MKDILTSRLLCWQKGELSSLSQEDRQDSSQKLFNSFLSVSQANSLQTLKLAKKGRYIDAMNTLRSQGCTSTSNTSAIDELKS